MLTCRTQLTPITDPAVSPRCGATHVVRNGLTHSGTPAFRCRGCHRRFVEAPQKGPVPDATRDLIRRLLADRMGLRAIARVTGVSRSWPPWIRQRPVLGGHPAPPRAAPKKSGRLVIEADELWRFVGDKGDVWWVWVALDADSRQVVAMVAGDRSERTARRLWAALPDEYRGGAVVHIAAGKDVGLTNHVEQFWCTLRQRCARFVRKTLSFSRCPLSHVGALWYFVPLYNASRL